MLENYELDVLMCVLPCSRLDIVVMKREMQVRFVEIVLSSLEKSVMMETQLTLMGVVLNVKENIRDVQIFFVCDLKLRQVLRVHKMKTAKKIRFLRCVEILLSKHERVVMMEIQVVLTDVVLSVRQNLRGAEIMHVVGPHHQMVNHVLTLQSVLLK